MKRYEKVKSIMVISVKELLDKFGITEHIIDIELIRPCMDIERSILEITYRDSFEDITKKSPIE